MKAKDLILETEDDDYVYTKDDFLADTVTTTIWVACIDQEDGKELYANKSREGLYEALADSACNRTRHPRIYAGMPAEEIVDRFFYDNIIHDNDKGCALHVDEVQLHDRNDAPTVWVAAINGGETLLAETDHTTLIMAVETWITVDGQGVRPKLYITEVTLNP